MNKDKKWHTELVAWPYVARHERKGWMTRDFFINGLQYEWLCNQISAKGIVRHGIPKEL